MLIGLSGKKRVGKDTLGHYLELAYGFRRVGFADEIKRIATKELGWDGKKDIRGRKLLQDFGMVIQAYEQTYWVHKAFKTIERLEKKGTKNVAITDLRFAHEAEAIRGRGGYVIRIHCPELPATDQHVSEIALDSYTNWDAQIVSKLGDFNGLYEQMRQVLEQFNAKEGEAGRAPVLSVSTTETG